MSNSPASAATTGRRHAMDSAKKSRVPSLRFHKASGQMLVVLSGRAIYCGKPDDPATEARYHQDRRETIGSATISEGGESWITL